MLPDGRLSTAARKAILLNNLYGVDLDAQAVEVTKLSLLLKCLEGETRNSAAQQLGIERLLPTIDYNVKVGNSLVDPDFYDEFEFEPDSEQPVRPFSWRDEFKAVFKQGGFDAVIGNPPYVQLTQLPPAVISYCRMHYTLTNDLYSLFIERSIRTLVKSDGQFAFIIPSLFIKGVAYQKVRAFINKNFALFNLIEQGDRVFEGVQMPTCVFVGQKGTPRPATDATDFFATAGSALFSDIRCKKTVLSTLADVKRGLEIGRSTLLDKGRHVCLTGGSIDRYTLKSVRYISDATKQAFDKGTAMFAAPKVMIRETGAHFFATLDTDSVVTTRAIYSIKVNATNKKLGLDERFLLGVINSRLFKFYFKQFVAPNTNIFPKVRIAQVNQLPLPVVNLKAAADKAAHDAIVAGVDELLQLHQQQVVVAVPTQQQQLQRQLTHAERRLDRLVYALYGLTKEDIDQVEVALG